MNITIIGAGSYGLALAKRFYDNKNKVVVYSKVEKEIKELAETKMNKSAFKDFVMPSGIIYTSDIKTAVKDSNLIVLAVATKYLKDMCLYIKPYVLDKHILIASKGIDESTYLFASLLVKKIIKTNKIATISGPSFARDMITDSLIGLSLASTNKKTKEIIINTLSSDITKLRHTNDFVGVELCGTMKNVIAIISGMLDAMSASESTKAMFLTESLNDIKTLIKKLSGNEKTILSYAGFGDIMLTCTSCESRNYSFGKLLGSNASKKQINSYLDSNTVEGVYTLKSIYGLVKNKRIYTPIIDIIYDIVFGIQNPNVIYDFLRNK